MALRPYLSITSLPVNQTTDGNLFVWLSAGVGVACPIDSSGLAFLSLSRRRSFNDKGKRNKIRPPKIKYNEYGSMAVMYGWNPKPIAVNPRPPNIYFDMHHPPQDSTASIRGKAGADNGVRVATLSPQSLVTSCPSF